MADDFTPDKEDDFAPDATSPPAGKVPSPTGWRDASAPPTFRDKVAGLDRQNSDMWGALAAMAHGPAMGFEGEVAGAGSALNALNSPAPKSWDELVAIYRNEKARVEGEQKPNLEKFPYAPAVGAVLATPGSAPTLAGRLGMGAMQGGAYGVGTSDSDLTKGEFKGVGKDALKSGLVGLGGAAIGEALQVPGRMMANRAQKISDVTHAAELAAEQEARAGAVASATGKEGGLTAAAMKAWDRLEDAMFNPAASEESKAWARQFVNSDEGKALYNQVLKNYADEAPQMMGRLGAAKEARAAANAANKPELIEQAASTAAEAKLMDPKGVTGRLGEMARRNLPPMIGGALAGAPGAAAGGVVAGAMGKPGTIMSNMMKSPSMFRPLIKGAELGIGSGQAMSRAAPPLAEWSKFIGNDEGDE